MVRDDDALAAAAALSAFPAPGARAAVAPKGRQAGLAIASRSSPDCARGPYPTELEPSDHVLVAVDLVLDAAAPIEEYRAPIFACRDRDRRRRRELEQQIKGHFFGGSLEKPAETASDGDTNGCVLEFPTTLTSFERLMVHDICENLGLNHESSGEKPNRYITVSLKTASSSR